MNAISLPTCKLLCTTILSASLSLTGCQLPWKKKPEPAAVGALDSQNAVPAKELPPKKAAQVCLAAAKELDQQTHEPEALALYEKAREHNPAIKDVSRRLAVLHDRQGNSTKAREEYARALEESPRDADLLKTIGYFFYQRGQWDDAEKWLKEAVAIDAHHQRAWTNLGLVYGQQGRYQLAGNSPASRRRLTNRRGGRPLAEPVISTRVWCRPECGAAVNRARLRARKEVLSPAHTIPTQAAEPATDGRQASRWLRSLHAPEIRMWLQAIEVPEAGVSGMTYWTHLTRDHSFDPDKIAGLTIDEQAKLHAAEHYGY